MINTSYDPDRLWIKARLFINRAMDEDREFEEAAFWGAAALELLAKSALARINPLLIATPTADDGGSLMIAAGVIEDINFNSVPAKALWARSRRAFRPFDDAEAKKIANARNAYLHSGRIGFDTLPAEAWWPRFWAQAAILISHMDYDIADFVGDGRAQQVEAYLQVNAQHQQARLNALVERAKVRLSQHATGTLSARLARDWAGFSIDRFPYEVGAMCPACENEGRLQGEDVLETRIDDSYSGWDNLDDPEWSAWLVIGAVGFACPTCHLVLEDLELISLAGLETTFEVEGDLSDINDEAEYMNE